MNVLGDGRWGYILRGTLVVALAAGALACIKKKHKTEGGGSTSTTPIVANINGATSPSSAVGQPIEVNGSNFDASSATVQFTQGSITATATPNSSEANESSLVVTVPSGDSSTQFTVPGNVMVTVTSNGTTTSGVTLAIEAAPVYDINATTWATTTALPLGLTGLRAVTVPGTGSTAYVVVTGGYNGSVNTSVVYSNNLNADGTVGANWNNIIANQLPGSLAHHAMVEADASNSPVPANTGYIYVIGGQAFLGGSGSSNVFMASVNTSNGTVGTWTQLTGTLPQPLMGQTATVFHGWIYVVGGLTSSGSPSNAVYSAQVNSNGTLGTWITASSYYPVGISFPTSFGYGGNLYVLNGDLAASSDPNAVGTASGTGAVYSARVIEGTVGSWTESGSSTVAARKKHDTWMAFGRVMNGEGIYSGSAEMEWNLFDSQLSLGSWTGLANPPRANVYNAASVVSPLLSPAGNARYLMLGGEAVAAGGEGAISNQVYYNNGP